MSRKDPSPRGDTSSTGYELRVTSTDSDTYVEKIENKIKLKLLTNQRIIEKDEALLYLEVILAEKLI